MRRGIVSWTVAGSMSRNQQRSQLSASYCTTFRKGGEVTTSCTDDDGICGVACDWLVTSRASPATVARMARTRVSTSPSSCLDFLRMILATSRGGGIWFRFSLILRWDFTETAWFGGNE